MASRTDERGLVTTYTYDDRGLLGTRTTGPDRDTFGYDALRRLTRADRGATGDQNATSHAAMAHTELGDLDFETQTIADGTPQTV